MCFLQFRAKTDSERKKYDWDYLYFFKLDENNLGYLDFKILSTKADNMPPDKATIIETKYSNMLINK